jgi:hypothetical protein
VKNPIELPAPRPYSTEGGPPRPEEKQGPGYVGRTLNLEDYVINYASGGCSLVGLDEWWCKWCDWGLFVIAGPRRKLARLVSRWLLAIMVE